MTVFYSIGIRFYILVLHIVSPFNQKAKLMLSGRKNWKKRLNEQADPQSKYLWFHCSSLGEFEQGRPLIEASRKKFPRHKILLSFFSPSGYEIRKDYEGADVVCYMPFDSKRNASVFLDVFQPEKVFFVKYEYWHFFLKALHAKNIPTFLVSAIFRDKQIFFRWYGGWFLKILNTFTHLFVQDKHSETLLKKHGINNVIVAGDTRFDRVADVVKTKRNIPLVEQFKKDSKIVIAGSSWPADEDLLCQYINKAEDNTKFIIAPHEIHSSHIKDIESKLDLPYSVYTKLDKNNPDFGNSKVLIIDTIGILSSLYQYGDLAYIGGGFGVGIHNTLEAATYSIPVIFGPNYQKFREAVRLIEVGGAFSIANGTALNQTLDSLLNDDKLRKLSGKKAGDYIEANIGATGKILNFIEVLKVKST